MGWMTWRALVNCVVDDVATRPDLDTNGPQRNHRGALRLSAPDAAPARRRHPPSAEFIPRPRAPHGQRLPAQRPPPRIQLPDGAVLWQARIFLSPSGSLQRRLWLGTINCFPPRHRNAF